MPNYPWDINFQQYKQEERWFMDNNVFLDKCIKESLGSKPRYQDKYSIIECAHNAYLDEDYDALEALFIEERYKRYREETDKLGERIKLDEKT